MAYREISLRPGISASWVNQNHSYVLFQHEAHKSPGWPTFVNKKLIGWQRLTWLLKVV